MWGEGRNDDVRNSIGRHLLVNLADVRGVGKEPHADGACISKSRVTRARTPRGATATGDARDEGAGDRRQHAPTMPPKRCTGLAFTGSSMPLDASRLEESSYLRMRTMSCSVPDHCKGGAVT